MHIFIIFDSFKRTQKPKNQKIGMRMKRLMTLMTKNQKTGTSQNISQTLMPRNLTIGMMKWTVNGNHHKLITQTTK
jgi:hypothetical protein